jgi:hypothetical protein
MLIGMDVKITVDDCRRLLRGEVKDGTLAIAQFSVLTDLPDQEQFAFARELSRDISFYYELSQSESRQDKTQFSHVQLMLLGHLVKFFETYDDISLEDYADWVTGDDLYIIVASLLKNKMFPVDFTVDTSWLNKYANHPQYWLLKMYTRVLRDNNKPEIIAYCRKSIPNSEHMSDEMVLSVAGVKI